MIWLISSFIMGLQSSSHRPFDGAKASWLRPTGKARNGKSSNGGFSTSKFIYSYGILTGDLMGILLGINGNING